MSEEVKKQIEKIEEVARALSPADAQKLGVKKAEIIKLFGDLQKAQYSVITLNTKEKEDLGVLQATCDTLIDSVNTRFNVKPAQRSKIGDDGGVISPTLSHLFADATAVKPSNDKV